jgi:hypothetical protein
MPVGSMCVALPPRDAARLALTLAEEADLKTEALSADVVAQNEATGRPLNVSRADHRREHLDGYRAILMSYVFSSGVSDDAV